MPFDAQAAGLPYGSMIVPGRDILLEFLLRRDADGIATVIVQPSQITGEDADGQPITEMLQPLAPRAGEAFAVAGTDISVGVRGFSDYTLLIAKKDPGKPIVWAAFASLITGIFITFYLPRRRVWARVDRDGRLAIVARSDRYVDVEREFGRLLDDLVASRRPTPSRPTPDRRPPPEAARARWPACATSSGRSSRWPARSGRPRSIPPAVSARSPGSASSRPASRRSRRSRAAISRSSPARRLAVVAPSLAQTDDLAAALARARVPAVLLVDGDGGAEAVEALGTAASNAGLTVLRVGRTDPIALERSVIGFLVNRRAELDRRAADLEGQLAGWRCWAAGSTCSPPRSARSSGGPS